MRRFDPDTVQNGHIRGENIHILGLLRHFLLVRLSYLRDEP